MPFMYTEKTITATPQCYYPTPLEEFDMLTYSILYTELHLSASFII